MVVDEGRTDERAVFVAALEMEPTVERSAYLRETCRGDAALLSRVEVLLKAHEEIGDFLEPASLDPDIAPPIYPPAEDAGSVVGPYKLLEPIGEGGFGTVYMAEQYEPIRRRVALKIIKLGILYRAQGRYEEHDPLIIDLLRIGRRTYGERSVLAGYARHGLNVRRRQLSELADERNAAGDSEGAAVALSRLDEIDLLALEGDSGKAREHGDL